jgi:hypothetical protein
MILPIRDFRPDRFDRSTLSTLQPFFDLDFLNTNSDQLHTWFNNLFQVAKHDIGIAHCINQHQSSRNSLAVAGQLSFGYTEKLGCFSVYHNVDSISVNKTTVSGIKHWITSISQADYIVCKVGRHDFVDRCLLFLDLHNISHKISDNGYQPVGLKIAKPGSLILTEQAVPESWILHRGPFNSFDPQNQILSFIKYAFLTNFLGCAVGLLQMTETMIQSKQIDLDFEIIELQCHLRLLKQSWENNLHLSYIDRLDSDYWIWHDTQYTQTKKCLTDLLKLLVSVGSSRLYDCNTLYGKRFFDALIWASHGKPHYEQTLLMNKVTVK